jgi:MtaA/CmuA family methyltransferase
MMNSFERFQLVLAGRKTDRPLNFDILMAYAAHFIGQPLSAYYQDARVLVDANLAAMEAFDLDIVQVISDPYREAADAGLRVEFPQDGLPIAREALLQEPGDLEKLAFPAPANGRRMSDRLDAVRRLREQAGGRVPVMGWVEGALAEAVDLRGMSTLLVDMVDRPEWVLELLERCAEHEIAFARAQIECGADLIGLGDAAASQISPGMYRRFALPYEQRIFAAVKTMGAVSRLHICGNTTRIAADMARSGAQIIDFDWMVDLRQAAAVIGGAIPCGNIDPVAVFFQGTAERVRQGVRENFAQTGGRWISAAGCEIPDGTPRENMRAQAEVLKEVGAGL